MSLCMSISAWGGGGWRNVYVCARLDLGMWGLACAWVRACVRICQKSTSNTATQRWGIDSPPPPPLLLLPTQMLPPPPHPLSTPPYPPLIRFPTPFISSALILLYLSGYYTIRLPISPRRILNGYSVTHSHKLIHILYTGIHIHTPNQVTIPFNL